MIGRMVVQPLQSGRQHRRVLRLLANPPLDRRQRLPPRQRVRQVRRLNAQLLGLLAREIRRCPSPRHIPGEKRALTSDRIERRRIVRQRVPIDSTAVAASEHECDDADEQKAYQARPRPQAYPRTPAANHGTSRVRKRLPAALPHLRRPSLDHEVDSACPVLPALITQLTPPLRRQMPPQVVDGQGNANRSQATKQKSGKNGHRSIMPVQDLTGGLTAPR